MRQDEQYAEAFAIAHDINTNSWANHFSFAGNILNHLRLILFGGIIGGFLSSHASHTLSSKE
jgi:hypothetical protein